MSRLLVETAQTLPISGPALELARPRRRAGGVTVIIPCYNEADSIAATVRQVSTALCSMHRPYEIIVVDDGSADGGTRALAGAAELGGLRVLRNEQNRGYGFSIKRAVTESAYEIIAITDADGTYPNERVAEMIDLLDGVDMVVGARIGRNVYIPRARRPAKWFLQKLAAYLAETDIPDLNSGFRVMKRSLIQRFRRLLPDGFSFTTTITLALLTHGYAVRYVPIDYARRVGKSSIRPVRDTINFLGLIVRTVMYFKPLKVFGPASAAMLALSIAVAVGSKLLYGVVADVTAVTLATTSVQLLAIGLLADLIDKRFPRNAD